MNSPLARPFLPATPDRTEPPATRLVQAVPDQHVRQSLSAAPSAGEPAAAATAAPTKVDIRNVAFWYGKAQALRGISLPLYDRRVTAFIGPSGCGKSTLLRILNRIYELYPGQVATGEVLLDGTDILEPGIDLNRLRAKIGMVFQ
jgi:phosphate transport system ATP-binding protein